MKSLNHSSQASTITTNDVLNKYTVEKFSPTLRDSKTKPMLRTEMVEAKIRLMILLRIHSV